MEISRLLRVLITIFLVVTFFIVTFSAYKQNREIEAMVELSDATSSIATRLATRDLARVDEGGESHPYTLDAGLLEGLSFERGLGGDNFEFQVSISYLSEGTENATDDYGPEPPGDRMTCALSLAVGLYREGSVVPAKLEVMAWYA